MDVERLHSHRLGNINACVTHNPRDVPYMLNHTALCVKLTCILQLHKRHVGRLVIIKWRPMLMLSKQAIDLGTNRLQEEGNDVNQGMPIYKIQVPSFVV